MRVGEESGDQPPLQAFDPSAAPRFNFPGGIRAWERVGPATRCILYSRADMPAAIGQAL